VREAVGLAISGAGSGKRYRPPPEMSVFDKRTGRLISTTELPANAGGSPVTYSLGSRQFIVVPIGGSSIPAELVALALGGS
jgi:hypothetical protein